MHDMRRTLAALTAAVLCLLAATPATAQEQLPSGRLSVEGNTVGLVVGFMRGRGTLTFDDAEHPFSMRGFTFASVGATQLDGLGVVYNLNRLSDFEGRYWVGEGGLTVIQGGGSAYLKNDKGVVIYMDARQYGLELGLGGGSVSIELEGGATPVPASGP